MRRLPYFFITLLALGLLPGCGAPNFYVTSHDNDFTPPHGKPANPPPASAGERRLLTATSEDGIHFEPTGKVLTDQANVPDAVITDDGTIFVYYVGQGIENGRESTAVAISRDQGASWSFRMLELNDFPSDRDPSDPDVVVLDDGSFRMFYTTDIRKGLLGIAYADSDDGISFVYKGTALSGNKTMIDSTTFFFDGKWHLYVLDEKLPKQYHATSTDGKAFTLSNTTADVGSYILSNPVVEDDVVRMFGFSLPDGNIRSFTSTNATAWTSDDVALEATDESTLGSDYVQDSTVVRLSDGTYLMVYVSEM